MTFDTLKEKALYYRDLADYKLIPNSYIIAMVDGKRFSKMIKPHFDLPFDKEFVTMMNETAKYICTHVSGCKLAYTQSDEISFLITDFTSDGEAGSAYHSFRLCKLQSSIASLATAKFNQLMNDRLCSKAQSVNELKEAIANSPLYLFDCKAWNIPTFDDVYAWFLYRQLDCIRNSKNQASQTYCTYQELVKKTADESIAFLKEKQGIDWNDYSNAVKFGRFIYKEPITATTNIKGKAITFTRDKWITHEGNEISGEGKEYFKSFCNFPKIILT